LVDRAYRILRPGGRIVLVTPDVRSLCTHLETFYLHFAHVSFYHPRLLCFFLEHSGFIQAELGANTDPSAASPLMPQAQALARRSPRSAGGARLPYLREIPRQGGSPIQRLSYRAKRWLARWLILPFTDSLAEAVNDQFALLDHDMVGLAQALQSLNGPFECYATALKPPAALSSTSSAEVNP
jgi:hypothetical protein